MKLDSINEMKSLIIDLRGNSGGLLSNAIRILDYLIDKLSQFRHFLYERNLPEECRKPWVEGYRKWKKSYK